MKFAEVTLKDVIASTEKMNENVTGGIQYEYGAEYIIRGVLQTSDIEELGLVVVKKNGDNVVLLRDIADIQIGGKTPILGLASEKVNLRYCSQLPNNLI